MHYKLLRLFKCSSRSRVTIFIVVVLVWILIENYHLKECSTSIKSRTDVRQYSLKKRAVLDKDVLVPIVRTKEVNCKAIIDNKKSEIKYALRFMKRKKKKNISPLDYIEKTDNCSQFLSRRKYIRKPLTNEDFSIAYSILIYKDIEQFERLLRAIYRPQNYYCIHIDTKSPKIFHRAVQGISDCFPNVFIASNLVDVRWGQFTVLQADLICMRDLWKRYKTWKYFINLTGQEFPLRTNNELVEILKTSKGTAAVMPSVRFSEVKKSKIKKRVLNKYDKGKRTKRKLKQLPYDLTLTKGECHVVLPRPFVDYIFRSWVAKDFLEWLKHTGVPDETYIQTLNNSPQLNIPGAHQGGYGRHVRYKNWHAFPCHGKLVRGICINGVGDLQHITKKPAFFVNKFHLNFQYLTLDCMEEWFYNRTMAYYKGDVVFDIKPYIFHENVTI